MEGVVVNNSNTSKSKEYAIKIIVPVLLLCAVLGIWIVKNTKKDNNIVNNENPDFSLLVTEKIDLEKLK